MPTDPVARAVVALADRQDLSEEQAEAAFGQVMRREATPVQMAALLMGLRAKGETVAEVVGAVRALREAMVHVDLDARPPIVDTCGTGGGRVGTFNISTAAAFVVAGTGARVAKHGNRSFTSRSGSADVLEALGVTLPYDAQAAQELLAASGLTFFFAPLFHPAMKHVGPVRRELAVTTIMNLLGPLANPGGVGRQVVGVADPARAPLLAAALAALGTQHSYVVHARVGMDEIAPLGATDVWEVRAGEVRQWTLQAEGFGLPTGSLEELRGGLPVDNAAILTAILEGRDRGVRRSAVMFNAAAGVQVAGLSASWEQALEAVGRAIDDGRARMVLERAAGWSRRPRESA